MFLQINYVYVPRIEKQTSKRITPKHFRDKINKILYFRLTVKLQATLKTIKQFKMRYRT